MKQLFRKLDLILKKASHIFLFFLSIQTFSSQTNPSLSFDFNTHEIKENHGKVTVIPRGATLTEDRFGNKESALYLHGHSTSYLNLGSSELLKLRSGTISMWVNIQAVVLSGRGYPGNPFFTARNGPQEDFNIGCGIGYNNMAKRLEAQASKDSLQEAIAFARDTVILGKWYHLVVCYDDDVFALYIDGVLQQKSQKGFASHFYTGDSVLLGRSPGHKNQRFSHGIFDDIRFYDRILTEEEIRTLYQEPNPNRINTILVAAFKYFIAIVFIGAIIALLLIRNKQNLKKQREFYELNNRVRELEIKVIKTQMNPHFISNCLVAIQNLIYSSEIDKAGEYFAKFSLFLRRILDYSDKTYLTLEEELAIIKLNVELEQLRFKNEFDFQVNVDKDIPLNDILIPSLVTQPLIENAIWHGLLPLRDRLPCLTINIYKQNDKIYVAIEDNGVGRSKTRETYAKTSRGTKLATDKIESINKLRNNSDYNLEIVDLFTDNQLPAGTRIIIQLSPYSLDE